jgi:hypothetical protein
MNKSWVLQQLQQAHHDLAVMIQQMQADTDDDGGFPIFYARLPFVYRHLNCAWNMRQSSDEDIDEANRTKKSESPEWRGFPHDLDPLIHD